MELFRNPQIDFMGRKVVLTTLSGILVVASIALLLTKGLSYGIDFRGGADIVLRFADEPSIDQIRTSLAAQGFGGATIQKMSESTRTAAHDVLIRVQPQEGDTEAGDVAGLVINALKAGLAGASSAGGSTLDVNVAGAREIERVILTAAPGREEEVRADAQAIASYRNTHDGIFRSVDEAASVPGVSAATSSWLRENAVAGGFAIRSADYVGPSVGKELKRRATYAVIGALLAMLVYIWFRFEKLAFGVSAILTLAHDAIIALGAVSLTGKEFDLTVLAAILTIIGYSINDTIVIFDRIRENTKLHRGMGLDKLFNDSINQTLSRTILTTALVLLVVLTLWLFGGERLNPFSFTLLVGCISGTYSTIAVSCPIVVWWRTFVEKKATI